MSAAGPLVCAAYQEVRACVEQEARPVVAGPEVEPTIDGLAAAHAELARRQSFTDALLETIEVGIVSCDANGVFVVSNRAERAMFGFESGIDGLVMHDIDRRIDVFDGTGRRLPPDEYPLMRTLRGEAMGALEVVAGPAGGPYRNIVVRGRQIIGPDGALLGAVAALTDVTAERLASRELAEEHRKLSEAQRLGRLGSFEYDFANDEWTFSDNLARLWGFEPTAATSDLIFAAIHEADRQQVADSWQAAMRTGGTRVCEYRIHRATDGAERLIRCNLEVELGPDGSPLRGRGTHLDITDITAAVQSAQRANKFFDAVLTATPDYTFVSDLQTGAVIYGSPGKDVLGRASEQLDALGSKGIASLVHPEDEQRLTALNAAARDLEDGAVLQIQYRALHADGQWRWLSHRVTSFRRDADGRLVEALAVVRDVTDVVEAEQRLIHAARHDNLTGLPNRAVLIDRLEQALSRAAREGREVAVLFCDLDGFKRVNDTGGHAAGDAVLVETARRLRRVVREGDTVARVGGDEFVVVIEPWNRSGSAAGVQLDPRQQRDVAVRAGQRVADALREPICVAGTPHLVTASVGIAYSGGAESGVAALADEILHDADAAMYTAKGQGKNRVGVFPGASRGDLPC